MSKIKTILVAVVAAASLNLSPAIATPENDAFLDHGYSLIQQNRLPEAHSIFSAAIKVNPNDPEGWVGMGEVFTFSWEWEKAYDCFVVAINLNPTESYPWYGASVAQAFLGNYPSALGLVEQAMTLNPIEPNYFELHEVLLDKMGTASL